MMMHPAFRSGVTNDTKAERRASSHTAMDVSVSVVTWNSAQEIARCLGSLARQGGDRAIEVFVVDNASGDDTVATVRRDFPQVQVHANARNVGFAAAQSQAWSLTHGHYWLLLNPDVELREDCINRLVAFMDSHPRSGLVTARLVDADGRPQHCAQPTPSIWRTLLELLRLHKLLPRRWRGRLLLGAYWTYDRTQRVGWTWGTVLMARRSAVESVGPLDAGFFMYGEDLEWCLRMWQAGWEVWFCAEGEAMHGGAASARQRWQDVERQRRIMTMSDAALARHHSASWMATYRLACCVSLAVELCARALRRRPRDETRHALQYCWEALLGRGSVDHHSDPQPL
jgi:N-acetylglucosaminyl-diphospho-decaprenol L-rhamnosyltransferase